MNAFGNCPYQFQFEVLIRSVTINHPSPIEIKVLWKTSKILILYLILILNHYL